MNLEEIQPHSHCYLTREINPGPIWERLAEAGIRLDAFHRIGGCPFRGPFYQIMRYFLLAADLRQTRKVDRVDVVFVGFRDNHLLNHTPSHLAPLGSNLIEAWNLVLQGVPELRYVHVEAVGAGLRHDRTGAAGPLAGYLQERYGL